MDLWTPALGYTAERLHHTAQEARGQLNHALQLQSAYRTRAPVGAGSAGYQSRCDFRVLMLLLSSRTPWEDVDMPIAEHELEAAVLAVLANAAKGRGEHPHYLTAYQILERVPDGIRNTLIDELGKPGRHAGKHRTAVGPIKDAARRIAEVDYLDARGLSFEYGEGEELSSGYPVIGLYRLRR